MAELTEEQRKLIVQIEEEVVGLSRIVVEMCTMQDVAEYLLPLCMLLNKLFFATPEEQAE